MSLILKTSSKRAFILRIQTIELIVSRMHMQEFGEQVPRVQHGGWAAPRFQRTEDLMSCVERPFLPFFSQDTDAGEQVASPAPSLKKDLSEVPTAVPHSTLLVPGPPVCSQPT
jgi:hypothetical protein